MATSITYADAGTAGVGTSSAGPTCPATVNAGNLLRLDVATKYGLPDTPTGFTLTTGASAIHGPGGTGLDTGNVAATIFWKIADGSEGGTTVTVTCPSGNSVYARIHRYTRTATNSLAAAASNGGQDTATLTWSVPMAADMGLTTDDFVMTAAATNSDTGAASLEALTASGIVMGTLTERDDAGTSQGDDLRMVSSGGSVTSGTSAGVATYTSTLAAVVAGSVVVLRLREFVNTGASSVTLGAVTSVGAGTVAVVGASSVTLGAITSTGAGTVDGTATVTGTGLMKNALLVRKKPTLIKQSPVRR